MKVFNISNPQNFIKRIVTTCKGRVELVSETGMHIELTNGKTAADMLPLSYIKGTIDEMELCFGNSGDAVSVLNYLTNMAQG